MRFMMIVKASKDSEAGVMPKEELLAAMARFNEEMVNAGVMLEGTGLHPSSRGARVRFSGGQPTVIDGPFTETKEVIAGYWLIQARSLDEAIAWAKRAPAPHGNDQEGEIEVRQLFELEEFGESEAVERHRELAGKLAKDKQNRSRPPASAH